VNKSAIVTQFRSVMGRGQVDKQGRRVDKLFYNFSEADMARMEHSSVDYTDFLPNSIKRSRRNTNSAQSL
jgi:hypothetical protein